jgi:hypothetical protein
LKLKQFETTGQKDEVGKERPFFRFSALLRQAWRGFKTKMPDKSGIVQICGEGRLLVASLLVIP